MNISLSDKVSSTSRDSSVSSDSANSNSKVISVASLKQGQTVSGEIISTNGREIQIAIDKNTILNALLDNNMSFSVGQSVTFEVKSSSSELLSLSPLFENLSNDPNILKALAQAGLPVNQTSVNMVNLMMEQGMSIDKQSLQNIYKDVFTNKDSNLSDIVMLNKWNIPVTEGNLEQMGIYKNNQAQVSQALDVVNETLTKTLMDMVKQGSGVSAVNLLNNVVMALTGSNGVSELMGNNQQTSGQNQLPLEVQGNLDQYSSEEVKNALQDTTQLLADSLSGKVIQSDVTNAVVITADQIKESILNQTSQTVASEKETNPTDQQLVKETENFEKILKELGIKDFETLKNGGDELDFLKKLNEGLKNYLSNQGSTNTLGNQDSQLSGNPQNSQNNQLTQTLLSQLFQNGKFQSLLSTAFQKQWMLEPGEVTKQQNVDELFQRIKSQADEILSRTDVTKDNQNFMKSVQNLSENVEFMNQLNHVATYVQIPLKMSNQNAQGELYVYTNKKSLAKKDGNVSAHLHLDMEYLGAVDVQVAMHKNRVSTKFYLQSEELMDFISDNIHTLNEHLEKRGYQVTSSCYVSKDPKKIMDEIIQDNSDNIQVSQFSFDVRA